MQSVGAVVNEVTSHGRSCMPEASASQATVREYPRRLGSVPAC